MPPLPESRNYDHHSTSKSLLKALETVKKSQKSNWSDVKVEHFDLGKICQKSKSKNEDKSDTVYFSRQLA